MQRTFEKSEVIIPSAIVMMLVCIYLFTPIPEYFGNNSLLSALFHHFYHGNAIHLVTNSLAVLVLYSRKFTAVEFTKALIIGTLSWFCSSIPSIGFSNILFATMGLRTPSFKSSWWRSRNTIVFFLVMIAYLFIPGMSAITHIVSFSAGVLFSCIGRTISKNTSDYGKAKERS